MITGAQRRITPTNLIVISNTDSKWNMISNQQPLIIYTKDTDVNSHLTTV